MLDRASEGSHVRQSYRNEGEEDARAPEEGRKPISGLQESSETAGTRNSEKPAPKGFEMTTVPVESMRAHTHSALALPAMP
jgi:hypothetical protein